MSLTLFFTQMAESDLEHFRHAGNKAILAKIEKLLNEILLHPYHGSGKPEALKYGFSGCWSRRINREHRLIYELDGDTVVIHSLRWHYLRPV